MAETRVAVLLAAGGADWEADAMAAMARSGVVVTRRCVDVADMAAAATTGTADFAIIAGGLPGLDADAVRRLAAAQVGALVIATGHEQVERLRRMGITEVLLDPSAEEIAGAVQSAARAREDSVPPDPVRSDTAGSKEVGAFGEVVAVWGPTGAPGRTTVAIGLAAERAALGHRVVLIDADPLGGVIGQDLGVLEEVSGLLAAARRHNEGSLTPESFAACRVRVGDQFEVLTGLPRPDRWPELREGCLSHLIEIAAMHADVVVDVGFGLESDPRHQGRDRITLEALDSADQVVAVGSAEPAGLVRLARGLVDLTETGTSPQVVVLNRMRESLGWSRAELATMVNGYAWHARVEFVRHDLGLLDRAVVTGKSLVELGDSKIRGDMQRVLDVVLRSRTAGTAH